MDHTHVRMEERERERERERDRERESHMHTYNAVLYWTLTKQLTSGEIQSETMCVKVLSLYSCVVIKFY